MQITYKKMWEIKSFIEAFVKTETAQHYINFTRKLGELYMRFSDPISKFNWESEKIMLEYAVKGDKGEVIYSNVPHAKFPYAHTAENQIKMVEELNKFKSDLDGNKITFDIKKEDMFSENEAKEIPVEMGNKDLSLLRGLVICDCLFKMDGSIDRTSEKDIKEAAKVILKSV